MKKILTTSLLTILTCLCMSFGLAGCKKECKHAYDNACDTTCNKCEKVREVGEHVPEEDDGDCTTAVKCSVCEKNAVEGYAAHNDTDLDDDWTCSNPGCEHLFSVSLDGMIFELNEDGESCSVTGLAEGFASTEVIIPATVNGKPVTAIGKDAFSYRTDLTSVTIPDSVTSIGEAAFNGCTSLTSVTFGENSKLTTIGSLAFYDCESLTSVIIPDSVTAIDTMAFYQCAALESVTFGENSKLTTIGNYAFRDCSNLTSVTIPASVTAIGNRAFRDCSNLTSIYYEGTQADWTTLSANAGIPTSATVYCWSEGLEFEEIKGENDEVVGYSVTGIGTCTDTVLLIPATHEGKPVTAIGDYAFSKYIGAMLNPNLACAALTSVRIPNSVVTIGESAFYDCESLTSVTIPASVVTIGGHAFQSCNALESVTFGKNSRLTTIGRQVFNWCESLTSVTIPASVTAIGVSVFTMSSVTSIYFGGTQAEWAEVDVNDYAIPDNATVYYYSEEKPEGEGNYWHYDTSGVPTTEWDD